MKEMMMKMAAAFAAGVMAAGAQGAAKITVDEVSNHYPWDGKVDCVTTVSGLDAIGHYKYAGVFTLSVKKDGAKVSKTVTNDFASADGTYTNTFDCATLFGKGVYPNGGITVVDLVKIPSGVQLWADGPYWAECNVGANKPEEYGYYFWWGDTVGYTHPGVYDVGGWISVKDGTTIEFSKSSPANSTSGNNDYVDSSTGNLAAEHDAATAHLGGPWRMPTSDEIDALIQNCNWSWTENWNGTGVEGCVVTGKEAGYMDKSIFLPAAGFGDESSIYRTGGGGYYWSSTPDSGNFIFAYDFIFNWGEFIPDINYRFDGLPVRPVR